MILRAMLLSAASVALLAGAPALAQTKAPAGTNQASTPNAASSQSAMPGQGGAHNSARSAKAVEDSLRQAGMQELKVMDSAYLVSAKTKGGEKVTIFIDPPNGPSGTGNSATSSSGSGSGTPAQTMTGQDKVRKALQDAGFTDVAILDAAYLVSGKTSAGDHVTMMVDPGMTTGSLSTSSKIGPSSSAPAPSTSASGDAGKPSTSSNATTKP